MRGFPVGKLSWVFLEEMLHKYGRIDPEVLVGPQVGEDAAVVNLGENCLVVTTDPITFATDAIGYYAVQVNVNDVATTGAIPRWFLATLLLPERKTTPELVEELFEQLSRACHQMQVSLIGGHTEITAGLNRPIVVGTMLGWVAQKQLVTSRGARSGDVIILTKELAVEGTALIAREKYNDLKTKYDREFLKRCKNMLYDPGIGVLRDARTATRAARVHAMHDPTEGGLACGLWEIAAASQVGLVVDGDAIPIMEETEKLCQEYGLNPLGVIASGSLLIVISPEDAIVVLEALKSEGITAATIAEVVEGGGVRWRDGSLVPRFDRDEVTRLFQNE